MKVGETIVTFMHQGFCTMLHLWSTLKTQSILVKSSTQKLLHQKAVWWVRYGHSSKTTEVLFSIFLGSITHDQILNVWIFLSFHDISIRRCKTSREFGKYNYFWMLRTIVYIYIYIFFFFLRILSIFNTHTGRGGEGFF